MKKQTKYLLWVILFEIPMRLSFYYIVGFLGIYFMLTLPILAEYQSDWRFLIGILYFAFYIALAQIRIVIRSIDKIEEKYKVKKSKERNEK